MSEIESLFGSFSNCKWLERYLGQGFLRHQLNNPCDDQFEALPMHVTAIDARTTKHVSWRRLLKFAEPKKR